MTTETLPKDPLYRLTGEFKTDHIETRYLDSIASHRIRVAQLVLFFGALVFFITSYVDYVKLGIGDAYYYLLTMRSTFLAVNIAVSWALAKCNSENIDRLLIIALIANAIIICMVPIFRTEDRLTHQLIAVLMVLINYAIMPARMNYQFTAGIIYALLLPCVLWFIVGVPSSDITSVFLLMIMANGIGFFSARRHNLQGRNTWWQIQLLNQEIAAHKATLAAQKALEAKLRNQAFTDSLTKTHNRRSFFEHGVIAMNDPRQRNNMALIMFDLDHFKKINDTYGHDAGDQVLVDISRTCEANIREDDLLARLGGEEFAVLLFNTDSEQAFVTAERIRKAIADADSIYQDQVIKTSISIGLVDKLHLYSSLDKAMVHADMALYKAKEGGRNQIKAHEN